MDTVTLADAKEHLEELLERAARGEQVAIETQDHRKFELRPVTEPKRQIIFGAWKDKMAEIPRERLLAPLTEDELRELSGEESEP